MDINKLNTKLNKTYGGRVKASFKPNTATGSFCVDNCSVFTDNSSIAIDNSSVVLTGELDSWDDIVEACSLAIDKDFLNTRRHVVNHIELNGVEIPEMRIPELVDNSLEGAKTDVLVIGGGISGASILRELSKWNLDLLLVEKESDLAMQASGRNDGQVHPGVDNGRDDLKHKYVLLGNHMYEQLCKDLDVPFMWLGQYVAFKGKIGKPIMSAFAKKRIKQGITDTRVISSEELYKAQPHLNPGFDFGLYNSRAGSVCPYGLTIAYGENAVENGAKVSLNTAVLSMELEGHEIKSVRTNRGTIYPKVVINAAGTFADKIAIMADDEFFSIHPRRGTNSIMDHKKSTLSNAIVSARPLKIKLGEKHTKGGGILHTADHNLLLGPDAIETYERENFATNPESITNVINKQKTAISELSSRDIITYFTGVRAPNFEEDFIVERGRNTKNLIHSAAIQSPGITAAPAIALDIEKLAIELLKEQGMKPEPNENFNPVRHGVPRLREMDDDARAELIKENPDYGIMICRCEEISKGEIIDCLKRPIVVPTVDGIKKRIRPGMGRCQGGFCSPLVTEIISDYLNENISDVTKQGNKSVISYSELKERK